MSDCGLSSANEHKGLIVIGAGCMRTGTSSLKAALELLLHHPCYHMKELMRQHVQHLKIWHDAAVAEQLTKEQAHFIFNGYSSCTDFPSSFFYQDLMKIYPNAKVILTVRDSKKWAVSCQETVFKCSKLVRDFIPCLLLLYLTGRGYFTAMHDEIYKRFLDPEFDEDDVDKLCKIFDRYNRKVIDTVPKDRLLVFEVSHGWQPLCEFLDLPIPDVPFPRVNDTAEFKSRISLFKICSICATVGTLSVFVAGVAVIYKYFC